VRPPLTLDIGWGDLAAAAWACVVARGADERTRAVEQAWCPAGTAVAGLTVRTLFDAWLRARVYPVGTEVILTGFTLPDMARIVRENGLVPVCLDVDAVRMCPTAEELQAARSERTGAVVVAHLFGARVDLAHVVAWADESGVDVVEDAAQAYAADGWRGSEHVAVSLFSFGLIKTATALGGAVARVSDAEVRARMREMLTSAPPQSRGEFAARVLRAGGLRLVGSRPVYSAFVACCGLLGLRHDEVLRRSARSIRTDDFLAAIRRRPSAALLALLARRLARSPTRHIARRAERGETVLRRLAEHVMVPGSGAAVRTHWVLPVCVDDRDAVMARLRSAGFDPAPAGSVTVIGPAPRLHEMEERLLYVPVGADFSDHELDLIADAVL
jgi:dTDP-4-amino-4,6-dideoxygalactose transaminase